MNKPFLLSKNIRRLVAVAPKVAAIVNLSLKVPKKLMGLKDRKKKQLNTFKLTLK